jgi:hypothetical protein
MRTIEKGRSLFLVMLLLHGYAYGAPPQQPITGEIVETFCWATIQVGGSPHAACGIECVKRGIPMAIVDARTRKAYVLLPGRDKASLPAGLVQAMGQRVTIRGEIHVKGGAQFMTVQSWQKAR